MKPKISLTHPGSALLIVILVMTTIASIVLTATRSAVNSQRVGSDLENSSTAYQIAQSGLDEGLLRYYQNVLVGHEYGRNAVNNENGVGNYSLLPMRRGSQPQTAPVCNSISKDDFADDSNFAYDHDCPYYDLTVRTTVSLDFDTTATHPVPDTYYYDVRLFPIGVRVWEHLNIRQTAPFSLVPTFVQGGTVLIEECSLPEGLGTCTVTSAVSGIPVIIGATARSLAITVSSGSLTSLQVVSTLSSGLLTIGKGFTTIDAIGYAGGISRKLVLVIRPHDSATITPNQPSMNLLDLAQQFDFRGVLR